MRGLDAESENCNSDEFSQNITGGFVASSLGLEVFLEDVVGGSLLAPVPDDTRGALDHLPSLALAVDLAEASPLAQLHVAVHLDQGDAVLHAQSRDQLLVHGLIAVLGQDAEKSLALVESLLGLPHSPGETIGDESLLEDLLDSGVDIHGPGGGGGAGNVISLNIRHIEFLDVEWYSLVEVNQAIF